MAGQVVTVFGGSGFLGRYVVRALAKNGAVVRVAGRRAQDALICKPMGDVGQIVPVAVNIRDDEMVAAAVAGADQVVNLVGLLFERGPQTFDAIHHEAAGRIARAAANAGATDFLQMSAIGASAASESRYLSTKAAGEAAVRAAFPSATVLRPSLVFGPEDDFFNRFAGYARFAPALPLIGGGKTRFQPVYVCDVAAAAARALSSSDAKGKVFELGGPATYSFRELMEIILDITERRRFLVPVPFWAAQAKAAIIEAMLALPAAIVPGLTPAPPITTDQVKSLRYDNVVSDGAADLSTLGIQPTALEAILPQYLSRFRAGGGRGVAHGHSAL